MIRNICTWQQVSNSLHNFHVHPLSNTIELWCLRRSKLVPNSLLLTIGIKYPDILSPLSVQKHLIFFSVSLPTETWNCLNTLCTYLIFGFQYIDPNLPGKLINKRDNVLCFTHWPHWHFTYIGMYQFQHRGILVSRLTLECNSLFRPSRKFEHLLMWTPFNRFFLISTIIQFSLICPSLLCQKTQSSCFYNALTQVKEILAWRWYKTETMLHLEQSDFLF
jgi:hypothetical protein